MGGISLTIKFLAKSVSTAVLRIDKAFSERIVTVLFSNLLTT